MDPTLKLSLRGHKEPVSCICRHGDDLVSADRNGWIIIWSLITKRPRAIWKGHDGHILTLKSTEMGLLSHGRDANMRLWDLHDNTIKTILKNPSLVGSLKIYPKPPYKELPVNSLNFCNVDFWPLGSGNNESKGLVATPASVDSNHFDIYRVTESNSEFSVQRIVENFAVDEAKKPFSSLEEVNDPDSTLQLRENGIVMRLLFVAENLIFVGYESGAVFAMKLDNQVHDIKSAKERSILNKGVKVTLLLALLGHKPLPILSLEYDAKRRVVYCGSASKKILCIDISHILADLSVDRKSIETHCGFSENLITKELESRKSPSSDSSELRSTDSPVQTSTNSSGLSRLNKWGLPVKSSEKITKSQTRNNNNAPTQNSAESSLQEQKSLETFINLKHYGIQNIQVTKTGYITSFWDGVIKGFNDKSEPTLELERAEEAIQPTRTKELTASLKKSLCIYIWKAGSESFVLGEKRTQSLVSARSNKLSTVRQPLVLQNLLFVGYTDGLIRGYTLLE